MRYVVLRRLLWRVAARYLQLALDTNPHFHALHADEVRRVLGALANPSATVLSGVAP